MFHVQHHSPVQVKIKGKKVFAYSREKKAYYVGFNPQKGRVNKEFLMEIAEYLDGKRRTFSFEPDFSIYPPKVARVLEYVYKNLPYGKITTYGYIARNLNLHPRFVGFSLSCNKHLILVPCHRVVSQKGPGGFSAGIEIKRFLLKVEGVDI